MEDYFGVQTSEVIAFGDNFSDLDMLQHAGLGVAMGNAPDEIKQVSNVITSVILKMDFCLILGEKVS